MTTFVLIHGAGGRGSDWDLVAAELHAAGHETIAVDLPCEDEDAGLEEYRDAVVEAIGDRDDLVLVAQSLGGFTAPLVADVVPVDLLVLLTAMVPQPGESGSEWWANTEHGQAMAAQNLPDKSDETVFFHDVPADVLAAGDPPRGEASKAFSQPWPLNAWPDVPTRFLLCTDDRCFPPEWMRGVVRNRLGIEPDEVPGSHCAYLSRPREVAAAILRVTAEEVA